MTIVVSPFSNSLIRDWPAAHYSKLIQLLLPALDEKERVLIVGAPDQRDRAAEILRTLPADRVLNTCGTFAWDEVLTRLKSATFVIGNNSGIAHLAAMYGVPTICLFGGSHQRSEWRPLGPNVFVITRAIGCSPCHLDHNMSCRYDKACLREIMPEEVAAIIRRILNGARGEQMTLHAGAA